MVYESGFSGHRTGMMFVCVCLCIYEFTYISAYLWVSGSSMGKESTCNAGDTGSICGSGRSPGEGIGYVFQYSQSSLVAQTVKNLPAMRETWV